MNSLLNSLACLTVFSFSVYIIVRIVSRSVSAATAVFKNEGQHVNGLPVRNAGINGMQDVRRDMGFYESYLTELNTRYGSRTYAVLSLKCIVNLRRHNIKNTLLLLARKHPMLRARVARCHSKHASKWQFVVKSEEQFLPELRFVNTSNWKMVLEEELGGPNERSNDQPLWKTIVLREQYEAREKLYFNTLLFLFEPSIADRIAVVKFTKDFISMLCQLVNCDIHIDNTRTLELSVPTEEYLRPPFLVLLKSVFKQIYSKLQSFIHDPFDYHKDKRYRFQGKPLIVVKCLSEQDTLRLLNYCKRLNCSLIALFVNAWSDVMSSRAGSVKALCHRKPVSIVVDYRTLLKSKLPKSYLNNCSSCFQVQWCNLWKRSGYFGQRVRDCEHLLKSLIKKKKHLDLIWQLKYSNTRAKCPENLKPSPFEIADVGIFDFNKTWPFSLHEIFIGTSGMSTVNLSLLIVNNQLYCGMHLSSHFSGCADLLSALFTRIVQNMSSNS